MFFSNIHILTVLIATVVGMGIGFLWYSPFLFSKLWLASKGWSDDVLRAKKVGKSMLPGHLINLVSTFITALVLAAIFNSLIVTGVGGILLTGFLLWLAFMVPMKLADYVYGGDTFVFFLIAVGYSLVEVLAMSLITGLFS